MRSKSPFIIPVVFLVVLILVIFKSPVLTVNQIELNINDKSCVSEEIIKQKLNLIGENILFLNITDIEKLAGQHPCIRSISLEKIFPSKIKININSRVALARVVTYRSMPQLSLNGLEATSSSEAALIDWSFNDATLSGQNFIVDETGFIFDEKVIPGLPLIFVDEPVQKLGQQLDRELFKKAAKIFSSIDRLQVFIKKAKLDNKTAIMKINFMGQEKDIKMIFSMQKDILRQNASLQLILREAKINKKGLEIIDLRFDKPVVVYF